MNTLNITCPADVSKLTLEQILAFMADRPRAEIDAFKAYAATDIVGADDTVRKPGFFEIRNWFVAVYFSDAMKNKKVKGPTMAEKIAAL